MIGDWMKNPTFLAEAGHLLAGWLVPLLFRYLGGRRWERRGLLLFVAYALVKEFYVDLHFESGETWGSSALDFAFYMVGVGMMLVTVRVHRLLLAAA